MQLERKVRGCFREAGLDLDYRNIKSLLLAVFFDGWRIVEKRVGCRLFGSPVWLPAPKIQVKASQTRLLVEVLAQPSSSVDCVRHLNDVRMVLRSRFRTAQRMRTYLRQNGHL